MEKNKKKSKETLIKEADQLKTDSLPIIETHCHLDYLKSQPLEEILRLSKESHIEKIITVSVEPKNIDVAFEFGEKFDHIYSTQGIHPHEARLFDRTSEEKILKNSKSNNVVAIGEIGLDYHYDHSPRDVQRSVFEKQIQMAIDLNKPIVVHTREAEDDTEAILKNFNSKIKMPLVIHSFTSHQKFAEYCLKENYYIGFNGILTFPKAQNVRDVLEITPLSKILLETDAPFLAPVPFRGRENAPYYLPYIALEIAHLKNTDIKNLLQTVYQNTISVFNFR